ncbi:MAG: aminopeptidase P N-terminal domain-containing protein [Vicinamibacterales bacterium]
MHGARRLALVGVLACLGLNGGAAQTIPSATYAARRAAALGRLGSQLLIVPSLGSFKQDDQALFLQTANFLYLTGERELVGAVLVLDGRARTSTLFLPPVNPLITRPRPVAGVDAARDLAVDEALPIDSLDTWLRQRFATTTGVLVGASDPRGAVQTPVPMAGAVVRWRSYLGTLGWTGPVANALPVLGPLREVKDGAEVETLDRVGAASGRAMLAGLRALRPGRSQRETEVDVIAACAAAGARPSFWPWTMSGPRAVFTDLYNSFVDYEGHNRVMQAGELVRVDVGCQLDHYMGDVGRTAPVSGHFSDGQREAWDLFITGYKAGLPLIRDGVSTRAIYDAALDKVRTLQPTMKTPLGRRAADMLLGPHGRDAWEIHGVGLDDAEGLPETLRAGMTVAYELMFAVDADGFYLEDMLLVESTGYRLLTPGLPYTAGEIEAAMAAAK